MKSLKLNALILFFLISVFIVITWFRGGFIYGGAEVGLFTYNPQRWLEISKYVWWDAAAPGQLIPQFIAGVPIYYFFFLLSLIGFSAQNIQAIFFLLMLFLMGFGLFILSFEVFDETKKKYAIFAGLFYMFNVYTLVQVWHRFLYTTILLAATLPFLILFWRRWIKDGKIINLSLFLLINLLSVYMYGSLASVITVWVVLGFVSLAEMFFPWQGKLYLIKVCSRFIVGIVFWILFNIWWIAPTLLIAPGLLSQQHSSEGNLGTLVMLGRQSIAPFFLQLVNPYYLFYKQELGEIYSNIIFKIIPWLITAIIFFGLFISLKLKNYSKFGVIFAIALFLSKGAAPPFPYLYIFGFEKLFFLGVIRNPFEKLGIMLPLFGAVLFALGLWAIVEFGKKKFGITVTKIIILAITTSLVIYAWPMFTGQIFGSKEFPVKVIVPETYLQADNWIKQQKNYGVILHLPFAGRDVVTYEWGEGYHGVDQNAILFTALPSLSRTIGIKRVDDTLGSLTYIFNSEANKGQILKILQSFNIRFIVLHKDIKWDDKATYGEVGNLLNSQLLEKVLDKLNFLERQKQFGKLVIYKLTDENYRPTFTLSNNFQIVNPGSTDIMQVLSQTEGKREMITAISGKIDDQVLSEGRQVLIFPDKKIEYPESSPSAMISGANEIFTKILQMENYFSSLGDLHSQEITKDLASQTEKLFKISTTEDLIEYERSMKGIFDKYNQDLNIHRLFGGLVADTLRLHLAVLEQMGAKTGITKIIQGNLVKLELIPKYNTYGEVYKFTISENGNYDLISDFNQQDIKVNGVAINSKASVIKNIGAYEIAFDSPASSADVIVLKQSGNPESTTSGKILSFKKNTPVNYEGKISLEKPVFFNFAQAYHPGWKLTLLKEGQKYQTDKHFLGNLYGNAWRLERSGDFDFKIEFTPQKYVEKGIIISVGAALVIIILNALSLKKFIKK